MLYFGLSSSVRSAINRRTASAFSASDNGSEAIIASAAENESALIVSDSARLEIKPPTTSPRSFSGERLPPELPRRERRFATRCRLASNCEGGSLAAPFGSVNPLGQKVFILSDPSHFRTMTCLQRHLITAIIGDDRDRTDNLCLARAALSQLSYVPLSI